MSLLCGDFEKTVGVRQVATRLHTDGVELLLNVVTLRVRSKPVNKELKEVSGRGHLTLPFHIEEAKTQHSLSEKSEY